MNLRESRLPSLAAIAIAVLLSPGYTSGQGEPTQRHGPGWPQWRGPRQDAISDEPVTLWPPVKLWETNVGYGVSSPIALGGRVLAMGHRDAEDTVWCLDADTGRTLWKFPYPAKSDQTSDVRFPGPRSTPATDGKAVYTLSLEGRLHCLDAANGKLLWQRGPGELGANKQAQYGICCPVTLWGRMVIVDVSSTIVAMEKTTGKELWRGRGGGGWNGAAPVVVRLGDKSYVLHGTGRCLDAADGRLLWSVPYGEWSVATPVVLGDRFFLAPFHGRNLGGAECAVVQIGPERPAVVWKNDEVQGLCLSAVASSGLLFAPDRDDVSIAGESGQKMNLKCMDFHTGEVKWVQRPIPWPSTIVAGDKLVIQTREGDVILAEASAAAYKELGRVRAVAGRCWTLPALADGRLYCRNNKGDLVGLQVNGMGGTALGAKPPSGATAPPPIPSPSSLTPRPSSLGPFPVVEESEQERQARANWPQFRGPGGLGVASCKTAPTVWNGQTGDGILWKTPVPLSGYSSPIVWEDRVFLTGAGRQTREVYCFDARSGRLLWRKALQGISESQPGPPGLWGKGSQAASTPVTDGRNVWAIFANGDLACFDRDGRQLWGRSLGLPRNQYGHAASPALQGSLVFVQLDQDEPEKRRSKLLAIDGATGRTVWEAPRPVSAGWSSPILIAAAGRRQLITCGNPWVMAYDPATGREFWRADTLDGGYYAVPSPVYAGGLVFSVTEGAALAAIRPDGAGDVGKTHVAWTAEEDLPNVCSPVSDGASIYLVTSSGTLSCFDVRTGKRTWSKDFAALRRTDLKSVANRRTDLKSVPQADSQSVPPRSFEASPTLAAGRLYVLDNAGRMVILPAAPTEPKDDETLTAELGEACPGASPALVEGRIFIRAETHLYCTGASTDRR
jgi:outer membrane protein assembly factor BamB